MRDIQIDGKATIAAIDSIIKGLDATVTNAVSTLGNMGERSAKTTHWFKSRTGKLVEETNFKLDGIASGDLISNTGYAGYVQYGNRPGGLGRYIYPKRALALRFVIAGQVIFAKRVRSHGPLPYMTDASAVMIQNANSVFEEEINRLIMKHSK